LKQLLLQGKRLPVTIDLIWCIYTQNFYNRTS
jgi:hypothetical protein